MKKIFSTFIAVFALAPLLTCIPDINNGFAIQAVSEVPEEVAIGTEINVEMIDIEYHGETKKASSLVVYTPTGAKINSSKIKFNEAGKYVFEFSAVFENETVTKTLETMSLRTPVSMFSASNATIESGFFAYSDKLDKTLGIEEFKGIKVNSRDGGTVTFNKIIDFSTSSEDDSFIDFIVEPSTEGAYDIGEIIITLTDADDSNNKVDIRFVDGYAGSGVHKRLTYATARANNQYYAGYEARYDVWHINDDQHGTATFLTLRGLDQTIIDSFGTGYLNSQLFFDYSSKQIFVKSEFESKNSVAKINDLDNVNLYPTNPWRGFKNNRAIMSITTNDVSGTGGKYIVKSILGYDLSQELLRDVTAPKLSIDFDGYDRNDLPLAKNSNTYPLFPVDAFDDFDDDLYLNTKVQFYDAANKSYIDVPYENNRFPTYYYGKYLISVYCSDRSGNETSDSYVVNCSSTIKDIEIVVPEDNSIHRAFEMVELCSLDDVVIKNAQGKIDLRRYLIGPDFSETELKNDYFVPNTLGIYQVKYVVSDIYEKPVSKIVNFDIKNIEHPIIVEDINLPPVMIKDQYFDIPRVGCKYPSGDQIVDGEVEIRINGNVFKQDVLHVESLDDVVIEYIPHLSYEDRKTFIVKVVEGNDSNGRINKENYFYSEDSSYTPDTSGKALQFVTHSDSYINFIKSISSNDLSLSFALDGETKFNYESFNIKVRDKYDSSKTLTIRVVPSGGELKLYVPFDDVGKKLDCDANNQFELYYRAYYKSLIDRNYKDICIINYFDNGEPFTGFSKEVYVSFGFSNPSDLAKVSLIFINNQSFKSSIVKDNAGPQIVTDSNLNWANELGSEITISEASAFDVLSYVDYLYVSMTDSNGNKILDKADASIDHKVVLNEYGSYRIEYDAKDGNGRTSNRSFTICCVENEKPQLIVNFTPSEYYSVGSTFDLPSYTFDDNSKNCTLDVSLYLPSGQGIAIEHCEMVDGEISKENYLDLDHYSEQLVQNSHAVKLYMAGKYTLRYLTIDAYGNMNFKEFVLNVR